MSFKFGDKIIRLLQDSHWDANLYAMDDLPATFSADPGNGFIVNAVMIRPGPRFDAWDGQGEIHLTAVSPDTGERTLHRFDIRVGVDAYQRFFLLHEATKMGEMAKFFEVSKETNPVGWSEKAGEAWLRFFINTLDPCYLRIPLNIERNNFLLVACNDPEGKQIDPPPVTVHILGLHRNEVGKVSREPRPKAVVSKRG